jgi:hypothetical protein
VFYTVFMDTSSRASQRRRVVSSRKKSAPSWLWTMSRRSTSAGFSKFSTVGQPRQSFCAFDCTDWHRVSLTDCPPLATQDEWASVLALAHTWDFPAIRALAIQKLTPITSAIDKIVLAREHAVDEWLEDSYLAVCEAPKLPSPEDRRRLGMDDLIRVISAWEAMHTHPNVVESRKLRLSAFRTVFGGGISCSAAAAAAEDEHHHASSIDLLLNASEVALAPASAVNGKKDNKKKRKHSGEPEAPAVVPEAPVVEPEMVVNEPAGALREPANELELVCAQTTLAPEPAPTVEGNKAEDDWLPVVNRKHRKNPMRDNSSLFEDQPIAEEPASPALEPDLVTPPRPPVPKAPKTAPVAAALEPVVLQQVTAVFDISPTTSVITGTPEADDCSSAAQARKAKVRQTFSSSPKPQPEPVVVQVAATAPNTDPVASVIAETPKADDWFSAAWARKAKKMQMLGWDVKSELAIMPSPTHTAEPLTFESDFTTPGGRETPTLDVPAEGWFGVSELAGATKKTSLFGWGGGLKQPEELAPAAVTVAPSTPQPTSEFAIAPVVQEPADDDCPTPPAAKSQMTGRSFFSWNSETHATMEPDALKLFEAAAEMASAPTMPVKEPRNWFRPAWEEAADPMSPPTPAEVKTPIDGGGLPVTKNKKKKSKKYVPATSSY